MCWELMTWGKDVEILATDSLKDTYTTLVDELVEAVDALHTI